jgi:hypothetical protein
MQEANQCPRHRSISSTGNSILNKKRQNANPRHNFREDIIRFIKAQQERGHMIIFAGDFNEHINNNHTNIQHISQ